MTQKTWTQKIKPHLERYKKETSMIFNAHKEEVRRKGIKTISENNKLWNEKYMPKLKKVEMKFDKEYKKLWYSHNKR